MYDFIDKIKKEKENPQPGDNSYWVGKIVAERAAAAQRGDDILLGDFLGTPYQGFLPPSK